MSMLDFKRTAKILPKLYEVEDAPEYFASKLALFLYLDGFITIGRYEKTLDDGYAYDSWWDCISQDPLGEPPTYWILLEEINWPEGVKHIYNEVQYGRAVNDGMASST